MDKFEYQAKLEEIGKLVETGDYAEAAQIADTIEWKRVRSVRTLCTVSEIYEAVGRVEDSKAILTRAYRRSPNSRQILYRLTEVCVLTQEFDDAVEYYTEYVNLSPNDSNKYVLKYEIYKGRGSSVEEQIKVLEELKDKEYSEQWAYELASLYDQAGMVDKCIEECDDLALWFHSGKYVVQALKLKQKYKKLTPEQQTVVDNPSEIVDMETKEEVVNKAVPTLDEEIMKEMPSSETEVIADSIMMNTEKEIAAAVFEHRATEKEIQEETEDVIADAVAEVASEVQAMEMTKEEVPEEAALTEADLQEEVQVEETPAEETVEEIAEESVSEEILEEEPVDREDEDQNAEDERVKRGLKRFDTVSLQTELANSMKQILAGLKFTKKAAPVEEEDAELEPIIQEMEQEPEEVPVVKEEPLPVVTEDDVLTAKTINLGEKIKKETGEMTLREYAAVKAAQKKEVEKLTMPIIEAPSIEVPELEMPELPKMKAPVLDIPPLATAPIVEIASEAAEQVEESAEAVNETAEVVDDAVEMVKESTEVEPGTTEEAEVTENPENIIEEKKEPEENIQEEETEVEEVKEVTEELVEETPVVDPMSYTRNGLDEKEKSMLGFWTTIRGVNEQVDAAVTQIMRSSMTNKTSSNGNVILVGDAGNGRTSLAIAIAKIVGRCKGQQNAKVAKIYAEDLNNKDIAQVVTKIAGGVLIIEEAGDLSDGTISQLSMAMDFKTNSMVVFLEDERRYLQDLLARNPKFAQKFDITINVPMLTNDELVEFGKYYALQNDAVVAEPAVMMLYDSIGAMQTPEQPVAILDVKELMDKAIKRAKKFSLGKIFSSITGKRYDSENRIIIKANSFKKIK